MNRVLIKTMFMCEWGITHLFIRHQEKFDRKPLNNQKLNQAESVAK